MYQGKEEKKRINVVDFITKKKKKKKNYFSSCLKEIM